MIGIDIIPAQPPKGVSAIQGNFLSQAVQDQVKHFLTELDREKPLSPQKYNNEIMVEEFVKPGAEEKYRGGHELKRIEFQLSLQNNNDFQLDQRKRVVTKDEDPDRMVDVVLSDMSAPWEQTEGFWMRSLSDPYYRMMNTSGMNFRDHAGSMVSSLETGFHKKTMIGFKIADPVSIS